MSRFRLLAAAAAAAIVATLALPTAASAHDDLLSASITNDAVLETSPAEVSLTFTAEIMTAGAEIIVVDSTFTDHSTGDVVIDGDTASIAIAPNLPADGYQVRWRVVSSDGHPISNVIPFTIGDGVPMAAPSENDPAPTRPAATTEAPQTEEPQTEEPETPEAQGLVETAPAPTDAAPEDNGTVRTVLIGVGGAVVALAIVWIVIAVRRSRGNAAQTDESAK